MRSLNIFNKKEAPQKHIETISVQIDNRCSTYRFEDALNLTGFGKYNIYMTILCGGIGMSMILEALGFSYILPAAQCDLKLTIGEKGWIGAIPFIGLIISSYFWGLLADLRGRKKVLMISMFLGSTCSIIASFSPSLPIFAVLKLFASALVSAGNAIVFPYYGEFIPKKYINSMVSILSTVLVASTAITSIIAWGVKYVEFQIPIDFIGIEYRPWRLMMVLYAIPFIINVIAMFKASESPKFLMCQGRNEEALEILRSMYAVNTGNKMSDFPVKTLILDDNEVLSINSKDVSVWETIVDQTAPLLKPPLVGHLLKFLLLSFGVYASNAFFVWLPDIVDRYYVGMEAIDDPESKNLCQVLGVRSELMRNAHMANSTETVKCVDTLESNTYIMMIVLSCGIAVVNLFLAIVLRYISKKTCLLFVFATGVLACFSFDWIYNKVIAWLMIWVFQCNGAMVGVINTYGVEMIPSKYRSMAVCLIVMFGRLGSVVGTNFVGYLIEMYCPGTFYTYGLIILACLICSVFLPESSVKKDEPKLDDWKVNTKSEITRC